MTNVTLFISNLVSTYPMLVSVALNIEIPGYLTLPTKLIFLLILD